MSTLTYRRNGATRAIPVGFSWTTVLFGSIPSMIKGHWSVAIPSLLIIDLMAINMSWAVFGFKDALLSVIIARSIVAACRNRWLSDYYEDEGWTCREESINENEDY